LRKNKKGINCCFVKDSNNNNNDNNDNNDNQKKKNTCPVPRRTINGECKNPKYPFIGKNKQGIECCFAKLQK
jgi:hypothetical protein